MRLSSVVAFGLVSFLAVITACSGSGRNLGGGGRYCHIRSFEGFEQPGDGTKVVKKFTKTESEGLPDDVKGTPEEIITSANLPQGTYELNLADYMYLRKEEVDNRRRWVMTQVREEVDAGKMEKIKAETGVESETLYKSYRYCAGGYRMGDKSFDASMSGITKIVVSAAGKIEFETKSWGYRFNGEKDKIEALWLETTENGDEKDSWSKPEDSTKYSAPKDVFGEKLAVLSLRKLPNQDQDFYQIYTRQDLDDGKTFQFARVTLKRIPPQEAAPQEEEASTAQ